MSTELPAGRLKLCGTTTRTVLSTLTAVLPAPQFFAPAHSFATAHTLGHTKAKAEPGNTLTAKPVGDVHRAVTHTVPGAPAHPLLGENTAAAYAPERPSARYPRASRSLTAHTPAVHEDFRR
ncbi:hypothetical protein ACWD4G_14870 [Streptomyces sp. NPDC002643]